ncbi:GGDEF domain-containing protein [Shewanella sp. NIFS-20-20]|uniref:GGDEF domain-containing protein n=1 Tax=Shewanella sp. NIFS-20-20 TaxID=2853806 RepID=UPI001C478D15|nr:GGDEF domain-containing protein [Shewanella sp. NIFS-20-20]MBV7316758.1 GGDEF domain-containing protein [Shewanella sp. NIFS-20-20]
MKLLSPLLAIGSQHPINQSQQRKLLLVNLGALLMLLTTLAFWLAYLMIGNTVLVRTGNAQMLCLVAVPLIYFLNYRGHLFYACLLLFACSMLSTLLAILLGQGTSFNTQYFFVLFAILPLAMLERSRWPVQLLLVILNLATYIYFDIFQWPPAPELLVVPQSVLNLIQISVICSCVSSLLIIQVINERNSELSELNLENMANTDPLTQLANRRMFMKALQQRIANVTSPSDWLLLLDLDFFKRINDEAGHECGDLALIQVAKILGQHIQQDEWLARIGGEEFAIILKHDDHILQRCNAIRQSVAATPLMFQSHTFSLTVSIGLCQISTQDSLQSLLSRTDHCLYQAKAKGRNCVVPGLQQA